MMETSTILFHVGSGSMVFVGVAHTLGELLSNQQSLPGNVQEVLETMKNTRIKLPGRKVALFDLTRGFSLMMGASLIVLGVLNHLIASVAVESTAVLVLDAVFSVLGIAMSVRYFWILPTVCMAISACCYIAVLIL